MTLNHALRGRTRYPGLVNPNLGFNAKMYGALDFWFSSKSGVISNESGLVSKWEDLSGNSYDAIQNTDTNKPYWDGNCISFDGSNDFLLSPTTFVSGANVRSMIAVVCFAGVNTLSHILHYGNQETNKAWGINSRNGYWGVHFWHNNYQSSEYIKTKFTIVIYTYDGTNSNVYIDGKFIGSSNNIVDTGTNYPLHIGTRIGPSEYGKFSAYELIGYSESFSAQKVENITNHLKRVYSIFG